jgi:hypothetical protein
MTSWYRSLGIFALSLYSTTLLGCSGSTFEYKAETDSHLGWCLYWVCRDGDAMGLIESVEDSVCADSMVNLCTSTGDIEGVCLDTLCDSYNEESEIYNYLVEYGANCPEAVAFLCGEGEEFRF